MQIKEFKEKYKITPEMLVIFVIILALIGLRLIIQKYPELEAYQKLSQLYANFLMFCTKLFSSFFNNEFVFDFSGSTIISDSTHIKIDRFFFSLNQIFVFFALVLVTKSPLKNRILFFLFGFLVFSLYNIFRISFHIYYPDTISVKNWQFNILLIPRWIILTVLIYLYWDKFPVIKNFILNKLQLSNSYYKSFFLKLIAVIIFYYFTIIIIFNNVFFINGQLLVKYILSSSNYFINMFGYESWLVGKTLRGYDVALYMDDACIGVNLMFLFAAFIAMLPGSYWHKVWFIPIGLFIIVVFNIIRIVLIFISMSNNEGQYILPLEIHDIFTFPVLGFTLLLWVIWINKFVSTKS